MWGKLQLAVGFSPPPTISTVRKIIAPLQIQSTAMRSDISAGANLSSTPPEFALNTR
jgi:hypothetical protein